MRYRLIAIDLDGTLLDPGGEVHPENLRAIRQAQEAGVLVVPCTGRGWIESMMVLEDIPGLQMGVFITGAMVADIATGASIDLAEMEPHLVLELIDFLGQEPEAVLVYRDRQQAGHDYLVTGRGAVSDNTQWWFELIDARIHRQAKVGLDDLHACVRVAVVSTLDRVSTLAARVGEAFAGRVFCHHFGGVHPDPSVQAVSILEIFAHGVDKWRGIAWIARQQGIDPQAIAAIGDEINDLAMIRHAACGVAMGNAIPAVHELADRVTRPNTQAGVAHAIDRMLEGAW